MTDVKDAIRVLKEYDDRKRREAEALLEGMPVVKLYVDQHGEAWRGRRGAADLDAGVRTVMGR